MHIAVIGSRGIPKVQGGIENHCEHLYVNLAHTRIKITLIGRYPYIPMGSCDYCGINILGLAAWRSKYLETIVYTLMAIVHAKRLNADILHFHGIGPSLLVPLAKILNLKIVSTHHGFDYNRDKWGLIAKSILRLGERAMCRSDAVISISKHISDYLHKRYHCRPFEIPNGVALKAILPPGQYCAKHSLQTHRYLLFVGRLVPEKSIHTLIDAFKRIQFKWKLVIAGDNRGKDAYTRQINAAAAGHERIVLTGFITGDELQELYSNAGCFVLPSSHEGLPIALLEALSYGLPCVVSDIPAHKTITHESIFYFKLRDETALLSVINKAINKAKGIDRHQGRTFVKENFDWKQIAESTFAVYSEVMKR